MNRAGWALLALSTVAFCQGAQQPPQQPPAGKPQISVGIVQHTDTRGVATAPSDKDMYCSGYITTERVPEHHYIVGGQNSPEQSRFAGPTDRIFIYGSGAKEGDRFEIVRRVHDPDRYEAFHGQQRDINQAGEPYFERAIVRVIHVERNSAVAVPELSCADVMPGDIALPFVEREKPRFREVTLERYTPPTGKTTGRILLADEFDVFLGSKNKVYLSIGADKGLKAGDYLRVSRTYDYKYHDTVSGLSAKAALYEDTQKNPPKAPRGVEKDLPRLTLGDMIVLHVHPRSATAMIMTSYEDIHVGDSVELMDVSNAPPVSAAPTAAPGPTAATPSAAASAAATANPPAITCTASPKTVRVGDSVNIACDVASADNRPVTVRFSSNSGKLTPNNNRATLDTSEATPGPINVRATALDDRDLSASAVTTVDVEAAPMAAPTATKLSDLEFAPNSARVDNRAKAMLDDVALRMEQNPNSTVLLAGAADTNETPKLAAQRAQNSTTYLTQSKGIDSKRIVNKISSQHGRKVEVWSVPAGAQMPQE